MKHKFIKSYDPTKEWNHPMLIPGIMMVISLIFLIMTEILTFYLLLRQMLNAFSIWEFIEYSVLFIVVFAFYIFIDVVIILLLMDERD